MKKNCVNNSALLMILLMLVSCGVKGNPVPYSVAAGAKPRIINLQGVASADRVELKWNILDLSKSVEFIDIERSDAGSGGNECKDCPALYDKIGQLSLRENDYRSNQKGNLLFTDRNIVKGKIYNYRITMCRENKVCWEPQTIEIKYQ